MNETFIIEEVINKVETGSKFNPKYPLKIVGWLILNINDEKLLKYANRKVKIRVKIIKDLGEFDAEEKKKDN